MKIVIASDIHGSAVWCAELLKAFEREGADRLVLLGDILYHGPRNPLPEGYAPKEVYEMLNPLADRIIAVRGNCDSEVDQMVLAFNISSDYAEVCDGGYRVIFSHGHRAVPPVGRGCAYVTGHTHEPLNTEEEGFVHLNPGSVSLPKDGANTRGYITFEKGVFEFKTLDGKVYDRRVVREGDIVCWRKQ